VTTGKGEEEPAAATKMLAYMVKGVANNVKEIVAYFPTKAVTREQLYDFTWEVIAALKIAGIKVLSVVCDGASVNRGFFDLHKPVTKTKTGVVFDTVNLFAPERMLFFVSDIPHILKCIRNAFAKSGRHAKCKRKLTKNGQLILWTTFERFYLEDHESVWRQSHKLNAMNVYLGSFSCMRLPYAAQVMSNTVAQDLK